MEEKKKRKRGDERRDQELHLRMTKSEMELLELECYYSNDSKTDVVRKALLTYIGTKKHSY